jgi:hypothetical protein
MWSFVLVSRICQAKDDVSSSDKDGLDAQKGEIFEVQ